MPLHKEIFNKEQIEILPLVKKFSSNFGLVGGSATALHVGHRRSIDFNLFTDKNFDNLKIKNKIKKIDIILDNEEGIFTIITGKVKFTFFEYPFKIEFTEKLDDIIKIPNLLTLAAIKAHALGRIDLSLNKLLN